MLLELIAFLGFAAIGVACVLYAKHSLKQAHRSAQAQAAAAGAPACALEPRPTTSIYA